MSDEPHLHRQQRIKGKWGRGGSGPAKLKWKFHLHQVKRHAAVEISARKLGAQVWRLVEPITTTRGNGGFGGVRWQWRPLDWSKLELMLPREDMEGDSKLASNIYLKLSREVPHFRGHSKNQQNDNTPGSFSFQVQILHAQKHSQVLETKLQLSKKKYKNLLTKFSEEGALRLRSNHHKIGALTDEFKRERINCRKLKIDNSKLLNDLADAVILAKQFMLQYEKERKHRSFIEDIGCDLVKELENNKVKIQTLENECSRMRHEVEEKRRVLQIIELGREDLFQMKMVEAKLIIEENISQMKNLVENIETLIITPRHIDLEKIKEDEAIKVSYLEREKLCRNTLTCNQNSFSSYTQVNGDCLENRINQKINISTERTKVEHEQNATYSMVDMPLGYSPHSTKTNDNMISNTRTHVHDPRETDRSVRRISHDRDISSGSIVLEYLEYCIIP